MQKELTKMAIDLLKDLISIESFSGKEDKTADRIEKWFVENKIDFKRINNIVWAKNKFFKCEVQEVLL